MIITNTMIVLLSIGFLAVMFIRYRKIGLPANVSSCTKDMTEEEVIFNIFQKGLVARRKYRFSLKCLSFIAAILMVLLISNGIHGQLFISKSGYSYQPTFFWLSLISIGLMAYIASLSNTLSKTQETLDAIDADTGKAYAVIDKKIAEHEKEIEEYENRYK